ncbi:HAD-IIA family hydrolase [Nocardioides aequoreus]|uniref:HAD-IIA family hydrolase n=1 Tax=Nocardioides aequoreus TaxID=397278 RepID=UPI0004C3445D|nr:HAD-IIA family hydrolase [Nocardioides aequoreus]
MSRLGASSRPLREVHDVAVLDLDGVVYRSREAVPHAAESLNEAQAQGMHLAFVTNNASRTPSTVGEHLRSLGVEASDDDVVTSAQAAASLLARELPAGSAVLLLGGDGLDHALRERGLRPVTSLDDDPVAVAQGYGPDVPWSRMSLGAQLVAEGLPWVASNTDLTVPTARGLAPGNGAAVEMVARFAGREPVVAGKPQRPLFEETLARVGGERPLVVGDRLDTDIEGAVTLGWPSLLVLTGVTGLPELVAASPAQRPTYVGADLRALADPQPAPEGSDGVASLGGWTARVEEAHLVVEGDGEVADWWRVVAEVAWHHLDTHDEPVATDGVRPPG